LLVYGALNQVVSSIPHAAACLSPVSDASPIVAVENVTVNAALRVL
jgi:hypothetical protein